MLSLSFSLLMLAAGGCGGGGGTPDASTSNNATKPAPKNVADAGPAADGGTEAERPFAGNVAEATEMISNVVDKKRTEVNTCIRAFRTRKKIPGERVAVSFGIDMDGRLLGVTAKGKEDDELKACIQGALKGAPFPRSQAGVITVTKTYGEIVQ